MAEKEWSGPAHFGVPNVMLRTFPGTFLEMRREHDTEGHITRTIRLRFCNQMELCTKERTSAKKSRLLWHPGQNTSSVLRLTGILKFRHALYLRKKYAGA